MSQLAKKTKNDLLKALKDKREEYRKFKFSVAGSKNRDVKKGSKLKKEIARILTELNMRKHK